VTEEIRRQIMEQLRKIEQEENVRILYACESGSRAWGLSSEESDYDVRFLYLRPLDGYVTILDQPDVIERPISDKLDISGWDLKKALQLLRKSNPTLLEWLHSPISYWEPYVVAAQIRSMAPLAFLPKSCMYHYLNMAKRNLKAYLQGDRVKAKKYFYVLRPILACGWIEKFHEIPPMPFDELMEKLVPADSELRGVIDECVVRKKLGEELDDETGIHLLHDYLEERIVFFERTAAQMTQAVGNLDRQLDELFRSALQEVWGVRF